MPRNFVAVASPSVARLFGAAAIPFTLILAGCATPPPTAGLVPTGHQATLGKIALVALPREPEVLIPPDLSASVGSQVCLHPHLITLYMSPFAPFAALACAAAVAGTPPQPSSDELQAQERNVRDQFSTQGIQDALRDQLAAAMRNNGIGSATVAAGKALPIAHSLDYSAFSAQGMNTVVETAVTRISFIHRRTGALGMVVQAHVRLVNSADNAELQSRNFEYRAGLGRRFSDLSTASSWLTDVLERAYARLGANICDSMFLIYQFPEQEAEVLRSYNAHIGLRPLSPSPNSSKRVSARPRLEWESFPRQQDLKRAPAEMARVKNVTYDLAVIGPQPYRREGLTESRHRLETALPVGKSYFWSVRARFDLDGRRRVTEWMRRGEWSPDYVRSSARTFEIDYRRSTLGIFPSFWVVSDDEIEGS